MRVLGLNSPYALPPEQSGGIPHLLNDGGAALVEDGEVLFAAIEERHTRTRYAGGFTACIDKASDMSDNIDAIAFSSCCGPRWSVAEAASYLRSALSPAFFTNNPEIVVVGHHESHAAQGFVLSGYQRAIVAVLDGFGNLIEPDESRHAPWWQGRYERQSYYLAERNELGRFSLKLVGRDADQEGQIGLGELYGALTHFCGYDSYQHAGTIMALSAFGKPFAKEWFVKLDGKTMSCMLPNVHHRAAEAFAELLASHGMADAKARPKPVDKSDKSCCDIVAQVQIELTESLKTHLLSLAVRHNADRLVVTGGVALNCLAMGSLAQAFPGKVFVPPAPSDTGQALGNALWAMCSENSPLADKLCQPLRISNSPFWGISHSPNAILEALKLVQGVKALQIRPVASQGEQTLIAAEALSHGKIVATCLGRAEYGPRALGGRSILADPRNIDSIAKVNAFKQRESFRPFAPAILSEYVADYFPAQLESPFMSFALPFRDGRELLVPAVVHVDKTARFQTVSVDSGSTLRHILENFNRLTNTPLLLNTSFNRKGEPMVETPEEAVKTFICSHLDMLLLDGFLLEKTV